MTIGRWFSFQGRIGRQTWWLGYVLPLIGVSILASVLDITTGFISIEDMAPADGYGYQTAGVGPFSLLSLIPLIWGGLAGQVKRWHDRDKSGWFVLVNFIPLIGAIWVFVELGFLRGTPGPNRFGPDPLGGMAPQWQQQGWQGQAPQQWQQSQPQWQPPPAQGWQAPPQQQGWQAPPQGYPPPQGPGAPPAGYGQPPAPPGYGQQPPPGYGQPPQGSVPPVRRD